MGFCHRTALVEESASRADIIERGLRGIGKCKVRTISPKSNFVYQLAAWSPSQLIVDLGCHDRAVFELMLAIGSRLAIPVVVLTDTASKQSIRMACEAGMLLMLVGDQSDDAFEAIVPAMASRLETLHDCRNDPGEFRSRLGELACVEAAKLSLMSARELPEHLAYKWLRDAAMKSNNSISDIARSYAKLQGGL